MLLLANMYVCMYVWLICMHVCVCLCNSKEIDPCKIVSEVSVSVQKENKIVSEFSVSVQKENKIVSEFFVSVCKYLVGKCRNSDICCKLWYWRCSSSLRHIRSRQ